MFPDAFIGKLDPRKSETLFQILLLVLAIAAVLTASFFGPPQIHDLFRPVDMPRLVAAMLAAVLVHEGGHLLAALALDFHFLGLSLGPFRLQTLHGQWKFSASLENCFAASISASPGRTSHWRRAMLVVIAAGPLATFASAIAGVYMLRRFPQLDPLLLAAFVQVNALLALLSVIPNSAQARVRNDARLFLMLARKSPAMQEIEISVELTHLAVQGVSPSDYPGALLLKLASWRGRPEAELTFAQALVRWAMDSDEWALAEKWDARALALSENCPQRMQNQALATSGCLDVLSRKDMEAARRKLAQVNAGALFPKHFEHRTRAAQRIALGRPKASAEIIRGQYALPRGIAACGLERKLLGSLHMLALRGNEPAVRAVAAGA
jgi:hypothetical protein